MSNPLPIIDISSLASPRPEHWRETAEAIDAACREWGFFYVRGHGIDRTTLDEVWANARTFFARPLAEKLQIDIRDSHNHRGYGPIAAENLSQAAAGDLKETFDMGLDLAPDHPRIRAGFPLYGPNRYPDQPAGFRSVFDAHYQRMLDLGRRILGAMAIALDLPADFFDRCLDESVSVLRVIHYPPASQKVAEGQSGCGAHTDYGCITVLAQDEVGGLQVRSRKGGWIEAEPIADTFVINIGDLMARWTNDRWVSTAHRVRSPATEIDRYSMPFFVEPNFDTRVACIPSCQSAEHPSRYEPVLSGEWLMSRFDATYAYRKGV